MPYAARAENFRTRFFTTEVFMLAPEILVRPMTKEDVPACVELYIRTFSAPPWCDDIPSPTPVIRYFENFLQLDSFLGYIAFCDGKLAALSAGM